MKLVALTLACYGTVVCALPRPYDQTLKHVLYAASEVVTETITYSSGGQPATSVHVYTKGVNPTATSTEIIHFDGAMATTTRR